MGVCALDDTVMRDRIQQIVTEYKIRVAVETGTHEGLSTVKFSKMVPFVYGIDNDANAIMSTLLNLHINNASNSAVCRGNSPDVLKNLMPFLPDETIYLLDAHRGKDSWPLLEEIRTIRKGSGIIILHDMKVPDHPELGYDSYGHDLDYDYVKAALTEWSSTHRVEYNEKTEGVENPRGVGYIFPE